jgi:hypothetical protein
MVWAEMNGLIDRKAVLRLLEKLLFLHKEFKVVEEEFFAAAEDGKLLSLFLRGYKLDDELRSFSTTTVAKTRQKSSRKAKGGDAS